MSRGRHAAPRTRPAAAALRTALLRSGGFLVGAGVAWAGATVVVDHGYLDAFAAGSGAYAAGATPGVAETPQVRRIKALNREYDCSFDGLAPGVEPARAVVRVDGRVRLATFDEGWAMHLGQTPGTLVSVCAR